MNHLERSLSKERSKSKDQPSRKVDKTTGSSSWNFYDQFSGTLPRSGNTSAGKGDVPHSEQTGEELKI